MRECAAGDRSVHQIAQLCLLAAAAPQGEMFTCSLLNKGQKQALISLGKIHGGDTTGTTHCMGKIQLSGTGKAQDKTSKVSNSGGRSLGVYLSCDRTQQKCVENLMDFTKQIKIMFSVRCLVSQHVTPHTQLYNIN